MAFNEMSPQEQAQAATALLRQRGAPSTAENMNRAIMALMQGSDMTGDNSPVMERAMQRAMAPRVVGAARGAAGVEQPVGGDAMPLPEPPPAPPMQSRGDRVAQVAAMPPEQRNAAMPGGRRAGTINGAQRIDENDPTAGMFAGTQPRQADETGVDPIGLALALGMPMTMLMGGGPAMGGTRGAAPRAPAGGGGGAEYMGRSSIPPTGRMIDVPQTAIAGPQSRAMLPSPGAQQSIGASGSPPMISGGSVPRIAGNSGGTPQVSGPTVNQTRLPPADGDLRRRMIDKNMERSNRNASRTRDERAAGNTTKGRRERIDPVPSGEASPRAQSETIAMGKPRVRVQAGRE